MEPAKPIPPQPDVQRFLDAALDEILRAWAEDREVTAGEISRARPELAAQVEDLFAAAREIALLRPSLAPRVPGYRLLHEVGRGGMGIVYAARQDGVDRLVALKVLPDAGDPFSPARRRFLAEARSLGRVRHPHVVTIFDVIEADQVCAYAMEWVEGKTLAELLEELVGWSRRDPAPAVRFAHGGSASLPSDPTVWFCLLGIAIARALQCVHDVGLVHRDVKPANILLRADGTPLLSDFGLVRDEHAGLTRTGQVIGTPAFAPPEQLRGETARVDIRTDVFALGATLHCALAGSVPFAGRTPAELAARIEARARVPLTKLGVPRDLETIVGKCLEPEVSERYASAGAVADDLERLLALRPIAARPLGHLPRAMRALRRNRVLVVAVGASAAIVLLLCVLLAWALYQQWTLPARVENALRRARMLLLEPAHEERVQVADRGQRQTRHSRFQDTADAALRAYDATLDLDASRDDVRDERAVVAVAAARMRGEPADLPEGLRETDRWRGLLAFLGDDAAACHAAWAALDLSYPVPDPFIDAATGQLLLARDDPARAYPRLTGALRAWPEAGFLAIAAADCAVRLGDLAAGERLLARGASLGVKDTFDTHVRVRADLCVAQGNIAEARANYDWLLVNHWATTARVHYARLLEREDELERAVELFLDLVEREPDAHRYETRLVELAERWWESLSVPGQIDAIVAAWRTVGDECSAVLGRLGKARTHIARVWRQRCTADASQPSEDLHRPLYPPFWLAMEIASMTREQRSCVQTVPIVWQRRLAATCCAWGSFAARDVLGARSIIAHLMAQNSRPVLAWIGAIASLALAPRAVGQVAWTQLFPSVAPAPRESHAAAYDPGRQVVVMFGGSSRVNGLLADTWEWNGSTWQRIVTSSQPSARYGHEMAYDPVNRAVLLFGGWDGSAYLNDTWLWNGTSWTERTPTTTRPAVRYFPGLSSDSAAGRVWMFGGRGTCAANACFNDTWCWNGTNWIESNPTNRPAIRRAPAMAYDSVRRRHVLFGGFDVNDDPLGDTWEWDGSDWTAHASGPARGHGQMAFDPLRCRTLLHGGNMGSNMGSTVLGDTWEWDGSSWLLRLTTGAPGRTGHAIVWDGARRHAFMFGGTNGPVSFGDTWWYGPVGQASYSATCPGCGGTAGVPVLSAAACSLPWTGTTFTVQVTSISNGPPYLSFMLLGFQQIQVSLCWLGRCDCTLCANPQFAFPLTPASGQATWSLPIPASSDLIGAQFDNQTVAFNATMNLAIDAMSNGCRATIGTR